MSASAVGCEPCSGRVRRTRSTTCAAARRCRCRTARRRRPTCWEGSPRGTRRCAARSSSTTCADPDDLVSVGTIGLIKAVNSFRPDKNSKLATYASRCIENEILMYLRRISRLRSEVSFDEPLNTDWEGNELLLSDVLGTDGDAVYRDIEAGVEKELLRGALKKLPERDRRIMNMRFGLDGGEEMTQKDVADVLGISQSYISRLEKKIIARLKSEIGKLV